MPVKSSNSRVCLDYFNTTIGVALENCSDVVKRHHAVLKLEEAAEENRVVGNTMPENLSLELAAVFGQLAYGAQTSLMFNFI